MAFLKDCSHILIADKTGDVIRYDVKDSNPKNNGVLILGHLSMILDIVRLPVLVFTVSLLFFITFKSSFVKVSPMH